MRAYMIRRLLMVIPTLVLVSLFVFLIIRLIPGDIMDLIVQEASLGSAGREAIERKLGLDANIFVQYGRWLGVLPDTEGDFGGLLQGDLGDSLWSPIPVGQMIVRRLPVTVELAFLSILVVFAISIPVGVYSAVRQDSIGDYLARGFATGLIAIPNFWVGLLFIVFASLWFGTSLQLRPVPFVEAPFENLKQFIVPALVLGAASSGVAMRMTRSMMLDVLRQDYIRTAWAKGLTERTVVFRHAFRNAVLPLITLFGIQVSNAVGGSIIIESLFGLPGIGSLLVESVRIRNYTVVSGIVFVFSAFMILLNLVVDLTYGLIDPRVEYK